MARMVIDDKLWGQLEALLPERTKGGRPANDRLFIEAVCWVIRTGAPWRDMPGALRHLKRNSVIPYAALNFSRNRSLGAL
jgi:transposase